MDLEKTYKRRLDREERFNENIKLIDDVWLGLLSDNQLIFAIYSFFEEDNLSKAKQHFNLCGMLDAFKIKTYQDRMFDYAIGPVCNALMSDNIKFLKETYANLTYKTNFFWR